MPCKNHLNGSCRAAGPAGSTQLKSAGMGSIAHSATEEMDDTADVATACSVLHAAERAQATENLLMPGMTKGLLEPAACDFLLWVQNHGYRFCLPLGFGRTIWTGGGRGMGPDFWTADMKASRVSSSSATYVVTRFLKTCPQSPAISSHAQNRCTVDCCTHLQRSAHA